MIARLQFGIVVATVLAFGPVGCVQEKPADKSVSPATKVDESAAEAETEAFRKMTGAEQQKLLQEAASGTGRGKALSGRQVARLLCETYEDNDKIHGGDSFAVPPEEYHRWLGQAEQIARKYPGEARGAVAGRYSCASQEELPRILGEIGGPDNIKFLCEQAEKSPSLGVVAGLERAGGPEALAALRKLAEGECLEGNENVAARDALGRLIAKTTTHPVPRNTSARIITGRVLDRPGGKPVEGVEVMLWDPGVTWTQIVRTDRNGGYIVRAMPDEANAYALSVRNRTPSVCVEGLDLHVGGKDIEAEDLYLERPQSFAGTVRDTEGHPVAGALMCFFEAASPEYQLHASTDADGKYRMYVVPRTIHGGCYGTSDRYEISPQKEVAVAAGQTVTGVDFTVKSAPPFHGQVVLPDGKPARNAELQVDLTDDAEPQGGPLPYYRRFRPQVNDEGGFTGYLLDPFGRSCRSAVSLKVVACLPDRSLAGTTSAVAPKNAAPPKLKVVLVPVASVTVRVVSTDAKAINNAELVVSDDRRRVNDKYSERSAALGQGRYRLAGLIASQEYFVHAAAPGYRTDPENRVRFKLKSGEARDVGKLVLRPWTKADVPELVQNLLNGSISHFVVDEGAQGLIALGPQARSAEPEIIRLLSGTQDPDQRLIRILGHIGSSASIPVLEASLADIRAEIRQAAADAIARIRAAPAKEKPASPAGGKSASP